MSTEIKFEETVSYLLAKVTTAFRTSLERHMGSIGLHGGQIFVLMELWNQDGLRQVDIAKRLNVAAPTVTKMINGLVQINLVQRVDEAGDGRSTRVYLTDGADEIRPKIEAQWVELEESCLSSLRETERLMLFDLLSRLRNTYTGRTPLPEEE